MESWETTALDNSKLCYSWYDSLYGKGQSQVYAPCKLEMLMCIKRRQGYVTNMVWLFWTFLACRTRSSWGEESGLWHTSTTISNSEFPLHRKTSPLLSAPPLACAYSFFVLISKSASALMYYTWGNLTQNSVLRFQEDVVIFYTSNLCFVSFPNRTKKVRGWIFA